MRAFIAELKRRNVFRAGALYVAAAWALTQGIAQLAPVVNAPEWAARWFLVAACIGFPFWLAFAWFYEWTPEGFKREHEVEAHESITHHTGRKLDFAIIGVLAVAVVLLLTDRFVLRRGVNQAAAVTKHSIAVLPFVDLSPGKDQEYFSDGLTEELLNLLAKVPQLQVTARTSSFSFKGKEVAIPEIARQLHVAHVLEGSVRKSGNQLRITAQLIHATDGYHVWSQTWDRRLDDVFAVQDEIAANVVKELKVSLLGAAPTTQELNPAAYALFLQARQVGRQYTAAGYEQSNLLYKEALALDPAYAAAWNGLATNYINQAADALRSSEEGYGLAREAAEKALAIDPEYAPAYDNLGWISMSYDHDLAAAAARYQRALELDPSSLLVIGNAAVLAQNLGRMDQAIELLEYKVARDPVSTIGYENLGVVYFNAGRPDEAIAAYRTVLTLSPEIGVHYRISDALLQKGETEAALATIQREPSEAQRLMGLAKVYFALGKKGESDAALARVVRQYGKQTPCDIAGVLAFRGEADRAFEWLDKAVTYHDPTLAAIHVGPSFANIRSDPRWMPFLRKIGKAPEQLAAIKFDVKIPK